MGGRFSLKINRRCLSPQGEEAPLAFVSYQLILEAHLYIGWAIWYQLLPAAHLYQLLLEAYLFFRYAIWPEGLPLSGTALKCYFIHIGEGTRMDVLYAFWNGQAGQGCLVKGIAFYAFQGGGCRMPGGQCDR